MKNETLTDIKEVLKSKWILVFFLMMTSFLYDIVLFAKNGMSFSSTVYSVILTSYYFFWLISIYLGRYITIFFLIFNFLIFCVLKEYYKFHTIPLKFDVIMELYKDGFVAGLKNTKSLFDTCFWVFFVILLLQIKAVSSFSFRCLKKALYMIIGFIIVSILYFSTIVWGTEAAVQLIHPKMFLSYQQGMLYKIKWPMDLFLKKDNQINMLVRNGNYQLREKMSQDGVYLSLWPKHVYLIQVESLTTKAIENMPFLQKLILDKNSKYYEDKNHEHCIGSANTDFMMISGYTFDCADAHTLVYYSYPSEIYKKTKPISKIFKERGYETIFIHGYKGDFFNRNKHYPHMFFDKVYFEEHFSTKIKRGEWGISDYTLLKETSLLSVNDKSFYFIITAGMHPPYDIPEQQNTTLKSDIDRYLNAAFFLDNGLKELYLSAPDDSLFIIYGDHNIPDIKAFDTPVLFSYKGNQNLIINGEKEDGFKGTIYFVNSLFDERN